MLVWQKIGFGTKIDRQRVTEWLKKYDIKACELENEVGYTKIPVECEKDCNACLNKYLDRDADCKEFNEVRDCMGNIQLRMW